MSAPYTRDATAPQLRPIDPALHPLTVPDRDGEATPIRPRRPARPRLAVVAPSPRRRSIGVLVGALCAVIFVGLLGLTAVQVTLAQNQQRLDGVNRDVQDARAYYDRLRLAVARLQSPDYIVPAATERLGMVPAVLPTYLTPTADVVALVAASTGLTIADATSGTGAGRPEWGEVKEISGQAP
ncbi:MAG TPA: hypothetical protein VID93_04620 [Acidimicrobiales bacterium]